MNNIARRNATENERGFVGKTMGLLPAMRNKSHALADVENLARNPQLSKQTAVERQRLNAEKLTKGHSVLDKSNKENSVKALTKALGKENSQSRLPSARTTLQNLRASVKSTLTVRAEQPAFRVPVKPAKQKKNEAILPRSQSVTSLPSIVIQEPVQEKPEVKEIVAALEGLFVDDDKKNENDEILIGIYAKDIFRYLKQLESEQSVNSGYITKQHIMTDAMRCVLVDWMYEVQQSFELLQDTAQMAIALLDRFMQDNPRVPKDDLQLVGVTCIFIASKYEEMYPPSVIELVQVSADACSKSQILRMEQRIMKTLGFDIGRPPPIQFLRRYGRLAGVDTVTYATSKYIADLALVQYAFCHLPPSLLAASALYLAIYLGNTAPPFELVWTNQLVFYTEYKAEDLKKVVISLAGLLLKAPQLNQQSVQDIYAHQKRQHAVSVRTSTKADKLKALIQRS